MLISIQRFTLYIYKCLSAHVSPNYLAELRDYIRTWSTWDTIEAITQHRTISDCLRTFPVWSTEEVFRRIMDPRIIALDLDSICARLFLVLQDRKQYQRLLNLPEEKSQIVLNILQTVRPVLLSFGISHLLLNVHSCSTLHHLTHLSEVRS